MVTSAQNKPKNQPMFVTPSLKPVFTSVCAIIILLVGAISIPTLPPRNSRLPSPSSVTAAYGAGAEVVEETVTGTRKGD